MSGIRFASEEENLGVGSRPRPKKRRSSILKSPSRNALQDLDPNTDECDSTNTKKKRRSSRRVSFANTYQVQEFLTANQLKLLEDTNVERDTAQPFSPEKVVEAPTHTSSVQDAASSQSIQSDVSVGPGHCIRGLETLLSGPIKNQTHQEAVIIQSMIPPVYSQPRDGAVQLPMIDETCELSFGTRVESGPREKSDANNLELDEVQEWPGMTGTQDSLGVGLVGPRYHCSLPTPGSFSSSCCSSSFVSSVSLSEIHGPDIDVNDTANFGLPLSGEKYIAGLIDPGNTEFDQGVTTEPPVQKKDASLFLKSFLSTAPGEDSFNLPQHSTFSAYAEGDRFENQAPKLDSKDFLKSFMGFGNPALSFLDADSSASIESEGSIKECKSFLQDGQPSPATSASDVTYIFGQNDVAAEMDLTACISIKEADGECKKKTDASSFLKSFTGSKTSDDFGPARHSRIPRKETKLLHDDQKTQVFGRHDDANSGMDLTTCVGGMFQAKDGSGILVMHPDDTVRFGEDKVGGMQFTQCVGGLQEQQQHQLASSQKRSRAVGPLADITQTFDQLIGGGEMDLTTCGNLHIADSSNYPGPEADVRQTSIFRCDDTIAAMKMNTCLNYQGNLTKSVKEGSSSSNSNQDAAGDETRVFHRDDDTRVFHRDDDTAAMEITECLYKKMTFMKQGTYGSQREVAQQENIKPLVTDHTGTNRNKTINAGGPSCLVEIKHKGEPLEKSVVAESAGSDKTQIFNAEDVGCMEFTTCLGDLIVEPKSSAAVKRMSGVASRTIPSVQPKDLTTNFTSDDTCGMEMTTCKDAELVSTKQADKTRIFIAGETAHMELTACGGSLKPLPSMPSVQLEDLTRNFTSEDTGGMEMTTCIGGVVMESSKTVDTQLHQIKQVDKTHVFSADETAQMELTTCVGSLKPHSSLVSLSSQTAPITDYSQEMNKMQMTAKMEMTACIGGIFPKMSADTCQAETTRQLGDQTNIFSTNDTASMEMTKCIGGLQLPTFAARPQSHDLGDYIRVFTTDDTAQMEMTACIAGEERAPAVSTGDSVTSSTSKQHYPQDQTCTYPSGNTASMEITTCLGGLLTEKTTSQCPDDRHLSQTVCQPPTDHTCIFTSDNTASMEMTTCLGGIDKKATPQPPDEWRVSQTSARFPTDHTRIFTSDTTAFMEITTCLGGIDKKATPQSPDECHISKTTARLPKDHTHIFTSDNTASMEITTCLGGINTKQTSLLPDELHLSQTMAQLPLDQMRVFARDVSGKMELTACFGEIDSRNSLQHPYEDSAFPQVDSTRHFSDEGTEKMELTKCIYEVDEKATVTPLRGASPVKKLFPESFPPSEQPLCHQYEMSQQTKDNREAKEVSSCNQIQAPPESLASSSSAKEPQLTIRSSDTFTIETSSVTRAPSELLRRSDTYTLDKPTSASTIVENPTADTVQQMDGDLTSATDVADGEGVIPAMGELYPWGSLDSTDGIDDEQPVWVENTEDFAQLSAEAVIYLDSKTSYKLPSCAQDKAQDVSAPSLMLDSNEGHSTSKAHESEPTPVTNLQSVVSLTKQPSAPVSMRDFLEFVTSHIPKGRRSVLPCLPHQASPQTLSDFMEDYFIVKPKKELYEWAVSHLSSSIEKMQEAVNEQELRMSEDNPDIVTQVQCASLEEAAHLNGHIESLHKACAKISKGSFQEWRLKMVGKTHQSLKNTEAEMSDILSTLSSYLDTASKNMEELSAFKAGLDNTLTQLKSIEPPSQEEVKEFMECRKVLQEKQRQVEELKMSNDALESESLRLKEAMKQSQEELAEARDQEMLLSTQTTSNEALHEALVQLEELHCLQQWRWRQDSENELSFTFLEDSLVLTVKLGKEIGNGVGEYKREIDGLHTENRLADDASISAQLAHNLVKASINLEVLHSRYPTTAALKMLLQDVSEVVCQADGIARETSHISYRHVVALSGTDLIVEFSDLDAFVKFWVTFDLIPCSYPFSVISATFRHSIGTLGEQDIQAVVNEVKPGWIYLTRLVQRIDQRIKRHITQ